MKSEPSGPCATALFEPDPDLGGGTFPGPIYVDKEVTFVVRGGTGSVLPGAP